MSISISDIKLLWGRAAGICSNPTCKEDLTNLLEGAEAFHIGEMAHVIAKSSDGPRGNVDRGPDTYANLILLCPNCHRRIDKAPDAYSSELLLSWKDQHEKSIRSKGTGEKYASFSDLKKAISLLLIENHLGWKTLGPKSDLANSAIGSNANLGWELQKLKTLIPNNARIVNLIESNINLLSHDDAEAFFLFKSHALAFEKHQYQRLDKYQTFPQSFSDKFHTSKEDFSENNGCNSWGVSWSHLCFMDRVLKSHNNVTDVRRKGDILFTFARIRQGDVITLLCCNEYTLGVPAIYRALSEFENPNILWTGGNWNYYTDDAKRLALSLKIGLYRTEGINGAISKDKFWDYYRKDNKGGRVDC